MSVPNGCGFPSLPIVHAAADYVVINKPPGLLSVPGKGKEKQDCAASRVRALFPGCSGPLIVHRLDMDTSGLLVLGLTPGAQRFLSLEFEERRVEKAYVALVEGVETPDEGVIDLPMRLDPDRRPYQIIDYVHGRAAQTRYRVLARETDRTRLRFEPLTGRTHQIRVHAAAGVRVRGPYGTPVAGGLGAPILGDVLYGRGVETGERLMLHASELSFREPGGERVAFTSVPLF